MATKRPKFPEIRCWTICGNFNERTHRRLMQIRRDIANPIQRQFITWNQTSRRLYRYFFYRLTEIKPTPAQEQPPSDIWGLRFQALVRELRRRNGDYQRQWQRRIFQILELWHKTALSTQARRNAAWQTRAQILTSTSYWKRRQPALNPSLQTWINVLWRAAHLNQRKSIQRYDSAWQVTYRIIVATRFRGRNLGWMNALTRICLKWPAQR